MAQYIVDLVNVGAGVQTLIAPVVLAASTQGTSYDASNLDDTATNAIISVGAYGANNTTSQIQIEEYNGTTWSAISGMVATATTSNQTLVVRGQRTQRYVRANAISISGTTPSVALSVVLVAQGKYTSSGTSFAAGNDNYPST